MKDIKITLIIDGKVLEAAIEERIEGKLKKNKKRFFTPKAGMTNDSLIKFINDYCNNTPMDIEAGLQSYLFDFAHKLRKAQ